jgi:hypothetical protein
MTQSEPRAIAIDWSGRTGPDQKRVIWLAEASAGRLTRLENGRTRAELTDVLLEELELNGASSSASTSRSRCPRGTSNSIS